MGRIAKEEIDSDRNKLDELKARNPMAELPARVSVEPSGSRDEFEDFPILREPRDTIQGKSSSSMSSMPKKVSIQPTSEASDEDKIIAERFPILDAEPVYKKYTFQTQADLDKPDYPPDPYPFDKTITEYSEAKGVKRYEVADGVERAIYPLARPFVSTTYSINEAFHKGAAVFYSNLELLGKFLSDVTGSESKFILENIAKEYEDKAEYYSKQAKAHGIMFMEELVGQVVGGIIPGVVNFMLDVASGFSLPAMRGVAKARREGKNMFIEGFVEAAQTKALSYMLRNLEPYKDHIKMPAGAAIFGAQAASQPGATFKDIAMGAGTGFFMTLPSGSNGGKMGVKEMVADAVKRSVVSRAERIAKQKQEVESKSENVRKAREQMRTGSEKKKETAEEKKGKKTQQTLDKIVGMEEAPDATREYDFKLNENEEEIIATSSGVAPEPWEGFYTYRFEVEGGTKAENEAVNEFMNRDFTSSGDRITESDYYSKEWFWDGKRVRIARSRFGDSGVGITLDSETSGIKSSEKLTSREKAEHEEYEQGFNESGSVRRFNPDPDRQVDFEPPPDGMGKNEIVRRSDLVRELREKLDIPIWTGRFTEKARAIFKVGMGVIRSKMANDIEAISHEVGHALHQFLWPKWVSKKLMVLDEAPLLPYQGELNRIATTPLPGQSALPEGFAEFIRRYITDAESAKASCPNFYEFFEKELDSKTPESKEILLSVRDRYDVYKKMPPLQQAKSLISFGGGDIRKESILDGLYSKALDDLVGVRKIVDQMRPPKRNKWGKIERLPAADDPYVLMRLLRGAIGKAQHFLYTSPFEFGTWKNVGKPLKEILNQVPAEELPDLSTFLVCKHALEFNNVYKESGLTPQIAKAVVKELEQKYGAIAKELYEYQDHVLQYLHDAGLIDSAGVSKMRELYKHYVPLQRVMDDVYGYMAVSGKGLESRNPIKHRKGSGRDIIDPLETIIKNTYLLIDLAEKNHVGQVLANLAYDSSVNWQGKFVELVPDPKIRIPISEVELFSKLTEYVKSETTTSKQVTEEIKRTVGGLAGSEASAPMQKLEQKVLETLEGRGWTPAEALQILNRIKKSGGGEKAEAVIEKIVKETIIKTTTKEMGLELPEGVLEIFRPAPYAIPGDYIQVWFRGQKKTFKVHSELAKAWKAVDAETMNSLIRVLAKPTSWLRAGATLTPEFAVGNIVRDLGTSFVYSKYLAFPGYNFIRGLFHAMKHDDWFKAFQKSGAEYSTVFSMDRDFVRSELQDIAAKFPVANLIKHPIELARIMGMYSEYGSRVGEFVHVAKKEGGGKKALQNKQAQQSAAMAARENVVDFARKGTLGRAINALIAFWNPAVQGTDRMVRQMHDDPFGFIVRTFIGITLPSILVELAGWNDPQVQEVTQAERDIFYVLPNPFSQEPVRIKKSFELGIVFGSAVQRAMRWILKRDPHAWDDFMSSFASGLAPSWIPTLATPIVENWMNRSSYTGRPIIPMSRQNVLSQYQYGLFTSDAAQAIGMALSKVPIFGQKISSPAQLENLIRGYTGGMGSYGLAGLSRIFDWTGIWNPRHEMPRMRLSDIPVIRAFVVRFPSSNTESIKRFYDNYARELKVSSTLKMLANEGDVAEYLNVYGENRDMVLMEQAHRTIVDCNKRIEKVYKSKLIPDDDKLKLITQLYMYMIHTSQSANVLYDEIKSRRASESPIGGD